MRLVIVYVLRSACELSCIIKCHVFSPGIGATCGTRVATDAAFWMITSFLQFDY